MTSVDVSVLLVHSELIWLHAACSNLSEALRLEDLHKRCRRVVFSFDVGTSAALYEAVLASVFVNPLSVDV